MTVCTLSLSLLINSLQLLKQTLQLYIAHTLVCVLSDTIYAPVFHLALENHGLQAQHSMVHQVKGDFTNLLVVSGVDVVSEQAWPGPQEAQHGLMLPILTLLLWHFHVN